MCSAANLAIVSVCCKHNSVFTLIYLYHRTMPYVRTGQRKVLNGRKRSRSAPAVLITPAAKRTKRKQWTEYQMEAAMGAVKSGKSGMPLTMGFHQLL